MTLSEELQHTNIPSECQSKLIQELAEQCDNEYYTSALGPPQGNNERARRGRTQILEDIDRLKSLEREVKCPVCHTEIARQIQLQAKGIREIERVWQM